MSRAVHKMGHGGSLPDISIAQTLTSTSSSANGATITLSKAVGTGGGRTAVVFAFYFKDEGAGAQNWTGCTIDGNAMTEAYEQSVSASSDTYSCALYIKALTTETGTVNIVATASDSGDARAIAAIVLSDVSSITATDTATSGSKTASTSAATTTTLEGSNGGIAVAMSASSRAGTTHSWGSSLTERLDGTSGADSAADFAFSVAYDLLPTGRSAATETVTWSASAAGNMIAATFR